MPQPQTAPRLAPLATNEPSKRVRLSLVIPICGGLDLTRACCVSILQARLSTGLPDELIVVDNGSDDGSAVWLDDLQARFDWVRIIHHPRNLGFAEGCNSGLRLARGDALAILNNDTLVESALFTKLCAVLDVEDQAGLVAPVSNYVMGQQLTELRSEEGPRDIEAIAHRLALEAQGKISEVDKLAGLCLVGKRSFFQDVGLFDPAYGLGNYEDEDLCLRTRIAGYRLLIAQDAYVHHFGNKSFQDLGIDYDLQLARQKRLHRNRWRNNELYLLEEALEDKDFDRALELGDPLEQAPLGRDWCHRARAKALVEKGREEEALLLYTRFVDRHPRHTESACLLAFCLLENDRVQEGRIQLARTLRECHLDDALAAPVLARLARWCWSRSLHDEARQHLASAYQIDEGFLPAKVIESGFLLEESRYQEALTLLSPIRAEENSDIYANLGIAHWHLGHADQARSDFERGASLGGPDSAAARNLAHILAQEHQLAVESS